MPGDSNYLSQHFRHTAGLGLFEAKGTCRQDVEVQAKTQLSEVCMHERQMSATHSYMREGNSLQSDEEGLWKSLYSTQIHVGSGTTIPHAFLTTFPYH